MNTIPYNDGVAYTNKKNVYVVIFILLVVVASFVARQALIGSAKVVRLGKAAPLTGIISQSLYNAGGKTSLPVPGKDYDLTNIHYFDNNAWVVVTVHPLANNFNQSIVILQKQHTAYQVVAGPGSAFPNDYLQSLPVDVGNYLQSQGVFYAPIN